MYYPKRKGTVQIVNNPWVLFDGTHKAYTPLPELDKLTINGQRYLSTFKVGEEVEYVANDKERKLIFIYKI